MVKCEICGTEFEGNFCPECGTKYESIKTCPKCGFEAKVNQKFCCNCGYSFYEQKEKDIKEEKIKDEQIKEENITEERIANIDKKDKKDKKDKSTFDSVKLLSLFLKFTPIVLFGLFSMLLWVFFACPVATLLGESAGNIYQLMGGSEIVDPIKSFIALIVFGALSVIMFGSLIFVVLKLNKKYLRINKHIVSLSNLMMYISQIVYLIFFIAGIVIHVKVSKEGLTAGSCSILLIVFSILFSVISLGCFIGTVVLNKKFNLQDSNASIEIIEKKKKEIIEPKPVDKIEKPKLTEVRLYRALKVVRIITPLIYSFIFIYVIFNYILPALNILLGSEGNDIYGILLLIFYFIIYILLTCWFFLSFRKIKIYSNKKYKNSVFKAIFANVLLFLIPALVPVFISLLTPFYDFVENYQLMQSSIARAPEIIRILAKIFYEIFMVKPVFHNAYGFIPSIFSGIGIVMILSIYICLGRIKKYFWTGKVKKNSQMNVPFDEFLLKRKEAKEQYKLYKKNQPKYNRYIIEKDAFEKQHVNSLKKIGCVLKNICLFHTKYVIIAALIIRICSGLIGFISIKNNIFRASKLDNFAIGETTQQEILKALGELYKENELCYEYFDHSYRKLNDKMEKIQYKIENTSNLNELYNLEKESQEIEKKLTNLKHKYIYISFANSSSGSNSSSSYTPYESVNAEKVVSEIKYDTKNSLTNDVEQTKEVLKIDFQDRFTFDNISNSIEPKIYYKDGSYQSYITSDFECKITIQEENDLYYQLKWSDSWGKYTIYVKMQTEYSFYDVKTILSPNDNGDIVLNVTGKGEWKSSYATIPYSAINVLNLGPDIYFEKYIFYFGNSDEPRCGYDIPNFSNLKSINFTEGYSNYLSIQEHDNTNNDSYKFLSNKGRNELIYLIDRDISGDIEIPNSVTSIGNSALYNCSSLTSIVIPSSVTSIGWDAFAYCDP